MMLKNEELNNNKKIIFICIEFFFIKKTHSNLNNKLNS